MATALEIRQQLTRLLAGEVSLDEFQDWFVPCTWNIHLTGDTEARELAYEIKGVLAEYGEDCPELRAELSSVLNPSNIALEYTVEAEKKGLTFLVLVDPVAVPWVAVFETPQEGVGGYKAAHPVRPRPNTDLRLQELAPA